MSNSACKARPMRDVGRGGDMTVHLPHGELVEGHHRQCRSADGLTMCALKRGDARDAPPHAEPVEARGSTAPILVSASTVVWELGEVLHATSLALRQAQDEGCGEPSTPMMLHCFMQLVAGDHPQCRSADGLTMCAVKRVDAPGAPLHAEPVEARGSQFTLW